MKLDLHSRNQGLSLLVANLVLEVPLQLLCIHLFRYSCLIDYGVGCACTGMDTLSERGSDVVPLLLDCSLPQAPFPETVAVLVYPNGRGGQKAAETDIVNTQLFVSDLLRRKGVVIPHVFR